MKLKTCVKPMSGSFDDIFKDSEEKIIYLVGHELLELENTEIDRNSILAIYNFSFENIDSSIDDLLDSLTIKSILSNSNEIFTLSSTGEEIAKDLIFKHNDYSSSTFLVTYDNSKTAGSIATKIYGQYLGQVNMTDEEQLDI